MISSYFLVLYFRKRFLNKQVNNKKTKINDFFYGNIYLLYLSLFYIKNMKSNHSNIELLAYLRFKNKYLKMRRNH